MSELSEDQKSINTLAKIVEMLDSRNEAERAVARQYLDSLGERKFDALLQVLKFESLKRKKQPRNVAIRLSIYFLLLMLLLLVPWRVYGKPLDFSNFTIFFYLFAGMGAAFAVTGIQKNALKEIEALNDKRAVGPWAEALEFSDKRIAGEASEKLIRLLPQLNASDAGLLHDGQRAILYKVLKGKKHYAELHIAILHALEQVGDERAVPYVERLADGEGMAARYEDVLKAAQHCLPFLNARVEQHRASQTLLRASSASDAISSQPGTLLRPALDSGATAPQELLRATEADQISHGSVTLPQSSDIPLSGALHRSE